MRSRLLLAAVLAVAASISAAFADQGPGGTFHQVKARPFDPTRTFLVQATWLDGIGCPTNAKTSPDGVNTTPLAADPACPSGDGSDRTNQGLLLAKTGPTANFASGTADLKDVPKSVTTVGYDLRKPALPPDDRGSHCGAGAPRFNIETTGGTRYFVGCNSPAPTVTIASTQWIRLRWTTAFPANGPAVAVPINTLSIEGISIVFDEGQDTGPDNFGLAVLDNIYVDGKLIGQGPTSEDRAR